MTQIEKKKGMVVYYSQREKDALKHIGGGSISEGLRVSTRWAVHFWNRGLRPDHNLRHVGLCLLTNDEDAEEL